MATDAPRMQAGDAAALLRRRVALRPTWFPVVGESMGSAIRTDSEVLVAGAAEPRFGEVWAFCDAQGVLVVHRLVRRRRGAFCFQGDAHWPDQPVGRELLVGRVVRVRYRGHERRLGRRDRLAGGARATLRGLARRAARRLGARGLQGTARALLRRRAR